MLYYADLIIPGTEKNERKRKETTEKKFDSHYIKHIYIYRISRNSNSLTESREAEIASKTLLLHEYMLSTNLTVLVLQIAM